jgi:hypothetical protein
MDEDYPCRIQALVSTFNPFSNYLPENSEIISELSYLDYNIAEFFYLLFFDFSHLTKTANGGGARGGDRGADGLAGEGCHPSLVSLRRG